MGCLPRAGSSPLSQPARDQLWSSSPCNQTGLSGGARPPWCRGSHRPWQLFAQTGVSPSSSPSCREPPQSCLLTASEAARWPQLAQELSCSKSRSFAVSTQEHLGRHRGHYSAPCQQQCQLGSSQHAEPAAACRPSSPAQLSSAQPSPAQRPGRGRGADPCPVPALCGSRTRQKHGEVWGGCGQATHLSSPGDGDGTRQQVPDDVLQGHAQSVHVDGVDQAQAVLQREAEPLSTSAGGPPARAPLPVPPSACPRQEHVPGQPSPGCRARGLPSSFLQ